MGLPPKPLVQQQGQEWQRMLAPEQEQQRPPSQLRRGQLEPLPDLIPSVILHKF